MTYTAHIEWEQPAPPGTYPGNPPIRYTTIVGPFGTRADAETAAQRAAAKHDNPTITITEAP